MTQRLVNAIEALSTECRATAGFFATDLGHFPTTEEIDAQKADVFQLCDQLDLLKNEVATRHVYLSEVEDVRLSLSRIGSHPSGPVYQELKAALAEQGPPWRP